MHQQARVHRGVNWCVFTGVCSQVCGWRYGLACIAKPIASKMKWQWLRHRSLSVEQMCTANHALASQKSEQKRMEHYSRPTLDLVNTVCPASGVATKARTARSVRKNARGCRIKRKFIHGVVVDVRAVPCKNRRLGMSFTL